MEEHYYFFYSQIGNFDPKPILTIQLGKYLSTNVICNLTMIWRGFFSTRRLCSFLYRTRILNHAFTFCYLCTLGDSIDLVRGDFINWGLPSLQNQFQGNFVNDNLVTNNLVLMDMVYIYIVSNIFLFMKWISNRVSLEHIILQFFWNLQRPFLLIFF